MSYRSLSDASKEVDMTISAKTINLLEVAVTQFVSAVLRLMIASREEECKHKEQTKVWHLAKDRVCYIEPSHSYCSS